MWKGTLKETSVALINLWASNKISFLQTVRSNSLWCLPLTELITLLPVALKFTIQEEIFDALTIHMFLLTLEHPHKWCTGSHCSTCCTFVDINSSALMWPVLSCHCFYQEADRVWEYGQWYCWRRRGPSHWRWRRWDRKITSNKFWINSRIVNIVGHDMLLAT